MDNRKTESPEMMADFFNTRAETYDAHQKDSIESFDQFYDSISSCVTSTKSEVRILDIGCGTGLELEGILKRKTPLSQPFMFPRNCSTVSGPPW
jgi:tRNA (cmo5U34)-methyltransferase